MGCPRLPDTEVPLHSKISVINNLFKDGPCTCKETELFYGKIKCK